MHQCAVSGVCAVSVRRELPSQGNCHGHLRAWFEAYCKVTIRLENGLLFKPLIEIKTVSFNGFLKILPHNNAPHHVVDEGIL